MTPTEIRAILVKAGYRVVRVKGSHVRLEADGRMPLTLALHSKELPPGLVRKILVADAQLTEDEIRDLK
jgi:predicted RNA binding protein YcfA (HicA-like mRNA interferase family)